MSSTLSGVINVLKPPGMTSHDVVAHVRKLLGERRVGHTGTLDPAAVGVLPLCVGAATRAVPFLQEAEKAYRAELTLGVTTDSQDAGGNTLSVQTDFSLSTVELDEALSGFLGTIQQVPPMTSAIRYKGKRLYEWAREGVDVERKPRTVEVFDLSVVNLFPDEGPLHFGTRVLFDVVCSKGTYVRTLCADVGARLGVGGHCSFLVRTRTASFHLEDSVTLEELGQAKQERRLPEYLLPVDAALEFLPKVELSPEMGSKIAHGGEVELSEPPAEPVETDEWIRISVEGELIAIGTVVREIAGGGWRLRPVRVFRAR